MKNSKYDFTEKGGEEKERHVYQDFFSISFILNLKKISSSIKNKSQTRSNND